MIVESTDLNTLISALIAFILAIIAFFNKQRTEIAKTTAPATIRIAESNDIMAVQGQDTRERDASGKLITTQVGTQYWMDADYTGVEPDLITKAAFSDAQATYDQTVIKAKALKAKYGADKLSPNLAALANK